MQGEDSNELGPQKEGSGKNRKGFKTPSRHRKRIKKRNEKRQQEAPRRINWRRILLIRGRKSEFFEDCASPYINRKLACKKDLAVQLMPPKKSIKRTRRLMRRQRLVFDSEDEPPSLPPMPTHKRYAISSADYRAWLEEAQLQGAEHGWAAWKASGYEESMSLRDFRRGKGIWRREVLTGKTRLPWSQWHQLYRSDFPDVAEVKRRSYLAKLTRDRKLLSRAKMMTPGIHLLGDGELGPALAEYIATYEVNTWVRLVGASAKEEIALPKKKIMTRRSNVKTAQAKRTRRKVNPRYER
ncbi:unnamed protein product [Amoebophrya sp. A25]|nr:unnamed protein product [Amoebophrya sp. A25]|eukprot:GSA25T00004048001.1